MKIKDLKTALRAIERINGNAKLLSVYTNDDEFDWYFSLMGTSSSGKYFHFYFYKGPNGVVVNEALTSEVKLSTMLRKSKNTNDEGKIFK